MKTTTYKKFSFPEILEQNTGGYDGNHKELIRSCPKIYLLLVSLLNDTDITSGLRTKIFTVIGYFIIPQDLFSEDDYGAIGYIDDILLSMHVIFLAHQEIGEENVKILFKGEAKEYDALFNSSAFSNAQKEYIKLFNDVLSYVGFV